MSNRVIVGFFAVVIGLALFVGGCQEGKMETKVHPSATAPSHAATKAAAAPATQAVVRPKAGRWSLAFSDDFNESKLGANWRVVTGEAKLAGGALVLKADEDTEAVLLLKMPTFPSSVRVEFDASISGAALSDISPILNAGDELVSTGYMFQFGASANTEHRLRKEADVIDATVTKQPLMVADKMHHVVAENDGGTLTLTVDNKQVFRYVDARPLQGPQHQYVGLYTFGSTVKIDRVMVYTKEPAAK